MAQYNSFPFQQKAIDELIESFKKLWQTGNNHLEITFKAPTGSGKTFMTTHFVDALNRQPDWDADVAFVWITFSDDLAMQSKEKFDEYFFPNLSNALLTIADFKQGVLRRKDVLFLNWQKLVSRKASDRQQRRPEDDQMRKEQGYYFEDVVEKTHAEGREIVLIIDESHKNVTEASMRDVIKPLNPRIILKVSATPETEPTASQIKNLEADFVEVARQDVVDAGLIKEAILSQTEDDLNLFEGKDHDTLLLDLAIEKRDAIAEEWQRIGENINPLILIQLPNDDKKDKEEKIKTKEEVVTDYLTNVKGVKKERIAYWFDGRRENMDGITEKNSKVDFMLFKYAAGTGWDCPRAHILVMYREIKSNTFHTQTLGRILRMPIFGKDLSGHPMLRTGYLFTNYQRCEVQNPTDQNKKVAMPQSTAPVNIKRFATTITKTTVQNVVETISNTLKDDPQKADKIKAFVNNVLPEIAESAKAAVQIAEKNAHKPQSISNIDEHKTKMQIKIEDNTKAALGDNLDEKLRIEIKNQIGTLLDSIMNPTREAEFILDTALLTDYISRTDYGDFGKSSVFQRHFKESLNKYFGIKIDEDKVNIDKNKNAKQLENKGVRLLTSLEREVIVNARFISDQDGEKNDYGKNVKYEVSNNDTEREFNLRCNEILREQAEGENGFGNIARTWSTLKEAIRQWFIYIMPDEYSNIDHYKIFLNDVNRGDSSVFRKAILQALSDYRPLLDKYLIEKKKAREEQRPRPFVLKNKYPIKTDATLYPRISKSYYELYLKKEYYGRENETKFIDYLEDNGDKIEWWFKNDTGREALGFHYTDSQTKKERIFYPDWLILFNDNRIGIFDTKGGITAKSLETKDKAAVLAHRIAVLNQTSKSYKYFGGIVEKRHGQWFYNGAEKYIYDSDDWQPFDSLFQ